MYVRNQHKGGVEAKHVQKHNSQSTVHVLDVIQSTRPIDPPMHRCKCAMSHSIEQAFIFKLLPGVLNRVDDDFTDGRKKTDHRC